MQSHRAVILNGSMTSQMHMRNDKDIVVSALCPHVWQCCYDRHDDVWDKISAS